MDEQNEEQQVIKLDGSVGLTARSLLTLITKDEVEGEREEMFLFPTGLIDMKILNSAFMLNFIKGYRIVKQETPEVK